MSRELLIELQKECTELAVAGSDLSIGNFKLEKLLPKFEKIGEKIKPFKMVSDRIQKLLNSQKEESGDNLIALSTLVNAIVLTQAQTGIEGEIEVLQGCNKKINTCTQNLKIEPVVEALTSNGGGRYAVIEEGFREGVFSDTRLLPLLIKGLDDKYAEIGQLIYDKLSSDNDEIPFSLLQETFNNQGKKGDALRLRLMAKALGHEGREFCIDLLEDSSKEVKIEAINILGNFNDVEGSLLEKAKTEILLEQVKSRAKDVRKAAYLGLVKINSEEARAELKNAIKKSDYNIVLEAMEENYLENYEQGILNHSDVLITGLKDVYEKMVKKNTPTNLEKIIEILKELRIHKSEEAFQFLIKCVEEDIMVDWHKIEYRNVMAVERYVVNCIAEYENIPEEILELIESRKERNEGRIFDVAFRVSLNNRKQEEVYEIYSPYFINKSIKKEILESVLQHFSWYLGYGDKNCARHGWYRNLEEDEIKIMLQPVKKDFDKRWVNIFKEYKAYGLLAYTIDKEDTDTVEFMVNKMKNFQDIKKDVRARFREYSIAFMDVAIGLIKIGHEQAYEAILEDLKNPRSFSTMDEMLLFIPYLPESYREDLKKFINDSRNSDRYVSNSFEATRLITMEDVLNRIK
ncbi:HEAT repeat domain-containing protein [Clostridium lundense]|uniref:HEAT repeat domain-containing protein n=1 Tax=Clostridium lundense TaxID=319475 RepID=UPI00048381F2|nr:HEAT repeat domain-containing protein [Clostridium lundense]